MLETLDIWRSTYAAAMVVPADPLTGATSLANWLSARLIGKLDLDGVLPPGPLALNFSLFGTAAFVALLAAVVPTTSPLVGATVFANAFQAGILASVAATLPGTSILLIPTPASTFSVVTTTTIIDSGGAAYAKVLELQNAQPKDNAADSDVPLKLREAVLLLKITTVGLDSTAPTPLALTDLLRAVK